VPSDDPGDRVVDEAAGSGEAPGGASAEADAFDAVADELAEQLAAGRSEAAEPAVSEIDALRSELQQARDSALRTRAELENYRKRAARELDDVRRYASLPLMRDLLPVVDNLDRAIAAAEKTHDTASLLEGVKIVAQQLSGALQRHGCVKIDALEQPFDPHRHEAISQQPSDEHPANTVTMVTQAGYQLHDRVVRPSQVIVSTDPT
jgi:molecular chaperone GrpE